MLPFLLLLTGGAVSLYCLWQFRRWLGESPEQESIQTQRLEVLVDELVATAEATSAVVQEKADALTELIGQADRRFGALTEAVEAARVVSMAVQAAPAAPAAPAELAPTSAAVAAPAPAVAASPAPVVPAAAEPEPSSPFSGPSQTHKKVYALADGGHDVTAIARRLGLSKGEVMLILGLRK